jgi:hypothetical protein
VRSSKVNSGGHLGARRFFAFVRKKSLHSRESEIKSPLAPGGILPYSHMAMQAFFRKKSFFRPGMKIVLAMPARKDGKRKVRKHEIVLSILHRFDILPRQ